MLAILSLLLTSNIFAAGHQEDDQNRKLMDAGVLGGSCKAFVEVDSYLNHEYLALFCSTSIGFVYRVPSATREWISEKIEAQELISGKTEIEVPTDADIDMETMELKLSSLPTLLNNSDDSEEAGRRLKSGTRTVLAIRITAKNQTTSMDDATLSNGIFGILGDKVNLRSQYLACSNGKLDFQPAADKKGNSSSITNGVVGLTVDLYPSAGWTAVTNAATSEFFRQFGVLPMTLAGE